MLAPSIEPRVSVIVPIYNTAPYLQQCIDSIRASSLTAIQILLVNDGSTDGSGTICDQAAAADSRITVVHQENQGLIAARLVGLLRATAEYVCYVDGDDWIEPPFVEQLLEIAVGEKSEVVIAGHIEDLAGSREVLTNPIAVGRYSDESLKNNIFPYMLNTGRFSEFGIFSYVWGKLFRREILLESQVRVDRRIVVGEDAACLYPIILGANTISVTDAANYVYRQRTNSMIKTSDALETDRMQLLYRFLKTRFSELGAWSVMRQQTISYVLSLAIVRCPLTSHRSTEHHSLKMFSGCTPGQRIALYGAGTFGQFLARRIQNDKHFSLAAWTDPRWNIYAKLGLDVIEPEQLESSLWDRLLVCYIDETTSSNAAKNLLQLGINAERISRVDIRPSFREEYLNHYGVET
jgi:glycosyltransferase involved in cell wall biosynthesis